MGCAKKSDLHLKSPRFIVALGIFVCYTLKIEGFGRICVKEKTIERKDYGDREHSFL